MAQPFYHLRPNKYVDRCLFVAMLERLNTEIPLNEHRYVGFGSYMFDDFKRIHDRLNLTSMISLEADPKIKVRADYNTPYKCIQVLNQTSTDFISGGEWDGEKTIIWLDYTSPELGEQFNDVAALSNLLNPHDIVRITLNANPSSLGKCDPSIMDLQQFRLEKLQSLIGEYIPVDTKKDEMTAKKYPMLLLRCMHKMLCGLFKVTKYDKRFVLPLFATVYQDGQTMLTLSFVVLDNDAECENIQKAFKDMPFVNMEWEIPSKITIPELTIKEILEMNKLLPSEKAQGQLMENYGFIFDGDDVEEKIKSYISFYKYYPAFQSINF